MARKANWVRVSVGRSALCAALSGAAAEPAEASATVALSPIARAATVPVAVRSREGRDGWRGVVGDIALLGHGVRGPVLWWGVGAGVGCRVRHGGL
ncbi:hypothetical protein GCM10009812_35320 [Nocardioides marinus]